MKIAKTVVILVLALGLAAKVANADFTFGEPTNLGPTVNSTRGDYDPDLSKDGLSLFFGSDRPGGIGDVDLWVTTRTTKDDPWGPPLNLGPTVNSSYQDTDPSISTDGLTLHFNSTRPGGFGGRDLWVTTRPTTDDPWAEPVNLGPTVNGSFYEGDPSIPADGLSLYFSDWGNPRPGGSGSADLWLTTRQTIHDDWGTPVNLGAPLNTIYYDWALNISTDDLLLLFTSNRPGGSGGNDTWMTTRMTRDDPWGPPLNLGPTVNSADEESDPTLSDDGYTLYFGRGRAGEYYSYDLWQASIEPVVDLNGDGIVDIADMRIMIDHWGENYSLCDIGPTPFGDGIVDVQDFIILAEHIEPEVREPALIAHWKLNEEVGNTAYDSIGSYDSILRGEPLWQPEGGKVGGALQFDGIDDYVETDFIINPADGSLSVFAWIKAGAPGQVIISQIDGTGAGSAWLCIDPSDGRLITKLMHPPFSPLESESIITDGLWHHVGVVYDFDGLHRCLYLDGAEVAKDASPVAAVGSDGGLYISADKTLEAATFFSGLIDDVRIYNRALSSEEIAALAQ